MRLLCDRSSSPGARIEELSFFGGSGFLWAGSVAHDSSELADEAEADVVATDGAVAAEPSSVKSERSAFVRAALSGKAATCASRVATIAWVEGEAALIRW